MRPLGKGEEGCENLMFSILSCIRIHYNAPYRILPPLSSKLLSFSLVFSISRSSLTLNLALPVSSATRYRALSGPLPSQGQPFCRFLACSKPQTVKKYRESVLDVPRRLLKDANETTSRRSQPSAYCQCVTVPTTHHSWIIEIGERGLQLKIPGCIFIKAFF